MHRSMRVPLAEGGGGCIAARCCNAICRAGGSAVPADCPTPTWHRVLPLLMAAAVAAAASATASASESGSTCAWHDIPVLNSQLVSAVAC